MQTISGGATRSTTPTRPIKVNCKGGPDLWSLKKWTRSCIEGKTLQFVRATRDLNLLVTRESTWTEPRLTDKPLQVWGCPSTLRMRSTNLDSIIVAIGATACHLHREDCAGWECYHAVCRVLDTNVPQFLQERIGSRVHLRAPVEKEVRNPRIFECSEKQNTAACHFGAWLA